jgi:prepilin-type processing-associated H-X9-DG protein
MPISRPVRRSSACARNDLAFTLVELLAVVGIVATLIGILLPSLARVRESARQVACTSNLRQLTAACIAYTRDNQGIMPAPSQGFAPRRSRRDWFQWQPPTPAMPRDPQRGGIMRYMSAVGDDARPLRCPSDDVEAHLRDDGAGPYRYSYSMNVILSNPWHHAPAPEGALPGLIDPAMIRNLKMESIQSTPNKVLFVEEDERNIDDGCWVPRRIGSEFPAINNLASRHERRRNLLDDEKRGNVSFADGHVEFVNRKFAHDPAHLDPRKP